ncbi:MAG: hypothetical protein NTV34_16310 [Proteobacteria bacterium]|nr:hypothetical protein [Pseudomonadota bacterium]
MRTHSIKYFLTVGLLAISSLSCKSSNKGASELADASSNANSAAPDLNCMARPDPMFTVYNDILSLGVNATYSGKKLIRIMGSGQKQRKSKDLNSNFSFDMSTITSVRIVEGPDSFNINVRGTGSVTMMVGNPPKSNTLAISSVGINPNLGVFQVSTSDRDLKLTSTQCDFTAHKPFVTNLMNAVQK